MLGLRGALTGWKHQSQQMTSARIDLAGCVVCTFMHRSQGLHGVYVVIRVIFFFSL